MRARCATVECHREEVCMAMYYSRQQIPGLFRKTRGVDIGSERSKHGASFQIRGKQSMHESSES